MSQSQQVFVCRRTFVTVVDGRRTTIHKDKTRVAANHELVKRYPDKFRPADEGVRFATVTRKPAAPKSEGSAPKPAKKAAPKKRTAKKG